MFEERLAKAKSGHFADSGLTFADIYLYTILVDWFAEKSDAAVADFPHVKKLLSAVGNNPGIAAWIAKRPKTVE